MQNRSPVGICMTQGTQSQCFVTPGEVGWGGSFQKEGIYVYLWLIHVSVWQKPSQYCNYPLIKNKKLKNREGKKMKTMRLD